jgi:hypothetical protein
LVPADGMAEITRAVGEIRRELPDDVDHRTP